MLIQLLGKKTEDAVLGSKTATENGVYSASDYDMDGFDVFTVAVPATTPVVEPLSLVPSTSSGTYTPSSGVDGFAPVSIAAVTSEIDSNIVASNIKSGVNILGVAGNVVELNGEQITITPSISHQTIIPESPYNAITVAYVDPVTSAIDSNIVAENIRSGVSILGVAGSMSEPSGTVSITTNGLKNVKNYEYADINVSAASPVINPLAVTPSTSSQSIVASSGVDGFSPVTVSAVDSTIDANIVAGNIKDGVTILGVTGSYQGATPSLAVQKVKDSNGKVVNGTSIIDLGGATDLGDCVLAYEYYGAFLPANTSIDFSSLTTISGYQAMLCCFNGTSGIAAVDFSSLVEIPGIAALQSCFSNSDIPSITFSVLSRLTGLNVFSFCFSNSSIALISFPALTSNSFGSYTNQFNNMLYGVTGCTVHFPSNLQSVIGSWQSVQDGFGGTNTTVLFDLPATE